MRLGIVALFSLLAAGCSGACGYGVPSGYYGGYGAPDACSPYGNPDPGRNGGGPGAGDIPINPSATSGH